jgi:hypothetical protein
MASAITHFVVGAALALLGEIPPLRRVLPTIARQPRGIVKWPHIHRPMWHEIFSVVLFGCESRWPREPN